MDNGRLISSDIIKITFSPLLFMISLFPQTFHWPAQFLHCLVSRCADFSKLYRTNKPASRVIENDFFSELLFSLPDHLTINSDDPNTKTSRHSPAPCYEVGNVIAGEECAALGRWQKMNRAHGENRSGQSSRHGFRHRLLTGLSTNDILLCCCANIIGVLWSEKREMIIKYETIWIMRSLVLIS